MARLRSRGLALDEKRTMHDTISTDVITEPKLDMQFIVLDTIKLIGYFVVLLISHLHALDSGARRNIRVVIAASTVCSSLDVRH